MVQYRSAPRIKYRFVLHFDDGTAEMVSLPDETVKLLEQRVERCTCERRARATVRTGACSRCRSGRRTSDAAIVGPPLNRGKPVGKS